MTDTFAADWVAAWNRHDLDAILSHYADDVVFTSPFAVRLTGDGTVRGKPALRAYFAAALTRLPDHTIDDCPPLDLVVVPGGWGTRREVANPRLVDWVRRQAGGARLTAAVCTGSFLLGAAGLLDGKRATTHWRSLDRMRAAFPG